ncbi:MAG: hypothetical protein GF329_16020 [Candidatus Lokiarchaeota archaeon]|nr:hypothetical protein [Candidatus Lokiarchaeota archaeon]
MSIDLLIEGIISELNIGLNYVYSILFLQLGLILIRQWYIDKKSESRDKIALGYGLYYLFLFVGTLIYFSIDTIDISGYYYEILFLISLIVIGIGGLVFTFTIENTIKKILDTKFIISILFVILLIFIPIIYYFETQFFYLLLGVLILVNVSLQIIFIVYFIHNTFGSIRKKLTYSLIGLVFSLIGLAFSSKMGIDILKKYLDTYYLIIFISKFMTIFSLNLILYGLTGYSFLLESQWKENLISLHIIDKKRHIDLFYRDFDESQKDDIRREDLFAGGISGIVTVIKEITESDELPDNIHKEDNLIMLEYGEKIITVMITRANLLNARYFLKVITTQFEQYYLDYYDRWEENAELFTPMNSIIKEIIKF